MMDNPLKQIKQAELAKQHQALFSMIANGDDPQRAGEILGYTPDAINSILSEMQSGNNVLELVAKDKQSTEEQLVANARPLAIHTLVNILQTSDNDTARVRAAIAIMSIDNGSVENESINRMKLTMTQMKKALAEQESQTIIDIGSNLAKELSESDKDIVEIGDSKVNEKCLAGAM